MVQCSTGREQVLVMTKSKILIKSVGKNWYGLVCIQINLDNKTKLYICNIISVRSLVCFCTLCTCTNPHQSDLYSCACTYNCDGDTSALSIIISVLHIHGFSHYVAYNSRGACLDKYFLICWRKSWNIVDRYRVTCVKECPKSLSCSSSDLLFCATTSQPTHFCVGH